MSATATEPRTLDELAGAITHEHEAAEADLRSWVQHAIRAGDLLIEAKARVRHGEWGTWLAVNVPFSARTAQVYMQIARNPQRAAQLRSIRAVLAVVVGAEPPERQARWPTQDPLPLRDPEAAALMRRYLNSRSTKIKPEDYMAAITALDRAKRSLADLVDGVLDVDRGLRSTDEVVHLARVYAATLEARDRPPYAGPNVDAPAPVTRPGARPNGR